MFSENPIIFKELREVSIRMHQKLDELEDYVILSDRISPLKVISLRKDATIGRIEKIFNFVRFVILIVYHLICLFLVR